MKRLFQLAIVYASLVLILVLPAIAGASGPERSSKQNEGQVIGLFSDPLACLEIDGGQAAGTVNLAWQGQAEQARLILKVAGAEAAHTIKVNGQPAAQAPIYPDGQGCGSGEVFYLDIPPEVLVQGDNLIEISNDALPGDRWAAADVRLEVLGNISVVETAGAEPDASGDSVGSLSFTEVYSFDLTFTSSYDGSTQHFMAQIPVDDISKCKTGIASPTPLVIYVHGRGGDMLEPFSLDSYPFHHAARDKGWLLASPQLHGSWPGTDDHPIPNPPGKYAYASLESQYDIIDTVNYMVEHCNVKHDQIYLHGNSMGGQIAYVTMAKYPHLFAALFANKGPSDMAAWYDPDGDPYKIEEAPTPFNRKWMERECYIDINGTPTRQTPDENPFCYQRRSGLSFAGNYIHVPISITHSISDTVVGFYHAERMRDAINSYNPDQPATVYADTVVGPTCGSPYHCYWPDPAISVLDFFEPFTLNNTPTHINITTDESKSYYWLNFAQTGGDHWSQAEVRYYPISTTVTAVISDTQPLTLGFNLGSTPVTEIISQPGMGLPATTYLVREEGDSIYSTLTDYTSGYLTTALNNTGQFNLTISAISLIVSANPSKITAGQPTTSTITVNVKDQLNHPVPDGTTVEFSTTGGTFPEGNTAVTTNGQAAIIFDLYPASQAEIVASVGSVTGTTFISSASVLNYSTYLPVLTK